MKSQANFNKYQILSQSNHYQTQSILDTKEFRSFAIKDQNISSTTLEQYSKHIDDIVNFTPYIIEERPMNVAQMDVFSRLMMDRIIFLGVPIDDQVANIVTAQLLFLESLDSKKDILIYLNSPGGSVYAGLGIYDTMQYVGPDVVTICTGLAASMGAVLLAGGSAKKRSALKHSRIMIHQPLGGVQGQASDIEITAKQILMLKQELYEILAKHTGKTVEQVDEDSDRDYWMTAEEAEAYGIIDEVLVRE